MRSAATTVAAYLKELPTARREALQKLRTLIRQLAPQATELMKYGHPHYELGGPLFALGAQKHYLALYVAETDTVEAFRRQLGTLSSGKSCIRFRTLDQLPLGVIEDLLRAAVKARLATADKA